MAANEREEHLKKYPNWTARENYAIHKKKKKKREKEIGNFLFLFTQIYLFKSSPSSIRVLFRSNSIFFDLFCEGKSRGPLIWSIF